jgi:stage V sporulation protein B
MKNNDSYVEKEVKRAARFAKSEMKEVRGILGRIKRRDLKGNSGQAIKNGFWFFLTNLTSKFGALIFTAIIARILLPELFGLYSLALSTIIFFAVFSDLGIDSAMITFIAKSLAKNKKAKAKAYLKLLGRVKLFFTGIISLVLLALAYFIANFYYQKPIFLALVAGAIYLPLATLSRFLETVFLSQNNFKDPFYKELIFESFKIFFVAGIIFFISRTEINKELLIAALILLLALSFLVSLFYLSHKSRKMDFLKYKNINLTHNEKRELKRFTLPLTVTILSGVFFGYIDMIMLGRFVSADYIGYYNAALSIVSSTIVMLGFMSTAVFPIFIKMEKSQLNRAFKRTIKLSFLFALGGGLVVLLLSRIAIFIIYGREFMTASIFLAVLSIIIPISIIGSIYNSYFVSQKRTAVLSKILIFTTIINIVLNYFLITQGLKYGMLEAVLGACIATIISKTAYLGMLEYYRRK